MFKAAHTKDSGAILSLKTGKSHLGDNSYGAVAFYGSQQLSGLNFLGPTNIIKVDHEYNSCLDALLNILKNDPRRDEARLVTLCGRLSPWVCRAIASEPTYWSWLASPGPPPTLRIEGGRVARIKVAILLGSELVRIVATSPAKVIIGFFGPKKDFSTSAVLRPLVSQLLKQRPYLFHYVEKDLQVRKDALFRDSSCETMWKIFRNMVSDSRLNTVYCVLGAGLVTDATTSTARDPLVAKLEGMSKRSSRTKLRVLVDFPTQMAFLFPSVVRN